MVGITRGGESGRLDVAGEGESAHQLFRPSSPSVTEARLNSVRILHQGIYLPKSLLVVVFCLFVCFKAKEN